MAPQKLQAGSDMPRITLPRVGGGEVSTEAGSGWLLTYCLSGAVVAAPAASLPQNRRRMAQLG